ncbi:MAG: hypothetical protein GEU80_04685 [Dehalococcoidia bacterium]|nr:hypothetical protein [Dehalococcoidia bacterium]
MVHEPSDRLRRLPFPFDRGRFPRELGAVVQRTVLEGDEPARIVVHDADGDWALGDGVHDPNEPGACRVTHIRHVVDADPTLDDLASMPPGHVAERDGPGSPWLIAEHRYEEAG